jgi:hypothetical protein
MLPSTEPRLELDHLVIGADTLAQGMRWFEECFGVNPGPGGQHPTMGTHNRLLSIASAVFPNAYLEIIAIDPAAPPPGRVRWFGLDEPGLRARLVEAPRLLHVVLRTAPGAGALDALRAELAALGFDIGVPTSLQRDSADGPLRWRLTVRDDGRLLCGGALPSLIEWDGRHPSERMLASGLRLQTLTLAGLPAAVAALLPVTGLRFVADAEASALPALRAVFATPAGVATLESD